MTRRSNPSPEAARAYAELMSGATQVRTQHERLDQEALTEAAKLRWWWPGYRHHMPERSNRIEAWQGKKAGVKPGWPDVTLHVPVAEDAPNWGPSRDGPVLAALELKAKQGRPTDAQLDCLRLLERCGYVCTVAYGWEEALAWLDAAAGPRPDVLPEGW